LSYYDDLGVTPHASPDEIREAYRTLVRLFHPDQQKDPALKRAAEGQMRRINECYEVLADPERRRRYDMQMYAPQQPRNTPVVIRPTTTIVVGRRLAISSWVWIAAAAASVGLIFWLSVQGQPRPIRPGPISVSANSKKREPVESAPVYTPPPKPPEPEEPAPERTAIPSRPIEETKRERPVQRVATMPPPDAGPSPISPPSPSIELPPPLTLPPVIVAHFGGFWAYPHARDIKHETGHYPPEFIETSIVENDGRIRGKYRARYYISDQAISPNVNFEFEGEAYGGVVKLPFHGDGGSRGTVQIKLVSDNEMEVSWKALDKGDSLGLVSGTAILMRRPN
jgi:hypothetical protein